MRHASYTDMIDGTNIPKIAGPFSFVYCKFPRKWWWNELMPLKTDTFVWVHCPFRRLGPPIYSFAVETDYGEMYVLNEVYWLVFVDIVLKHYQSTLRLVVWLIIFSLLLLTVDHYILVIVLTIVWFPGVNGQMSLHFCDLQWLGNHSKWSTVGMASLDMLSVWYIMVINGD